MNDQKIISNTDYRRQNLGDHWNYFLAAVMFYTRIPVPSSHDHSEYILQKSRIYFPVVGWIVGSISVLIFLLSSQFFTNGIAIALSIAASVVVTGAFHEDGFADSCDGLGGGWSTEQVLTIMKDSRLGSYATIGLILLLGTKFLILLDLSQANLFLFASIYICGHTVSRIFSSLVIEASSYVQDIDKSKIKPIASAKLEFTELCLSIGFAAVPFAMLLILFPHLFFAASIAITVAALSAFVFSRYCVRRIGGYTGDILGAIQQIAELVFYLAMLASL